MTIPENYKAWINKIGEVIGIFVLMALAIWVVRELFSERTSPVPIRAATPVKESKLESSLSGLPIQDVVVKNGLDETLKTIFLQKLLERGAEMQLSQPPAKPSEQENAKQEGKQKKDKDPFGLSKDREEPSGLVFQITPVWLPFKELGNDFAGGLKLQVRAQNGDVAFSSERWIYHPGMRDALAREACDQVMEDLVTQFKSHSRY